MNLEDAEKLLAWMRETGVVSARVGDLALTLGEAPPPLPLPGSPWEQYLREQAQKQPQVYASPEDDPDLYGREPPGLED
jgi:hypothetical protein